MMKIEIRRPKTIDIEELDLFFKTVVWDTFNKEGLGNLSEDIANEIIVKNEYLKSDIDSDGEKRYFLLATAANRIIGTIEYGLTSDLINNCTNGEYRGLVEIGTLFVSPNYQGQGVGNLLLNSMYITLKSRGIKEFCLDSGYKNAQKVWEKKFGKPNYLLKDYWGSGADHMIWRKKLEDVSIAFKI
ncbi:GNAT family N-acetyltransferase [Alkaliphilus serpentinus]|uniref:GNAT family N-acetyltransferase n=2 Tax=Alkaliphilus serpentinus TaxID=1482731 RepID=A0A833HL77_9FIRM|nr:GNAT family N-acetyltransferase [Alkaliphilus serpentinus]